MNLPSNLAIMQRQVEALFVCDDDGRLLVVNEPLPAERYPAPLVFVGQTDTGCVCRCRYDVPDELCGELEQVVASEIAKLPVDNRALINALQQCLESAGFRIGRVWEGPAFALAETPQQGEAGMVLDSCHAGLLHKHFSDIIPELEAIYPCVAVVEQGHAVSLCRTVRRSAYAVEAGVNTAVAYRRRGLATAAVARWASLVRGQGLLPLYSTSWNNAASRRLAERLGCIQYGIDLHLSE